MADKIRVLISENDLKKKVGELAKDISEYYGDREFVMVGVMKGALFFLMDLARRIKNENILLDFLQVSSYGNKKESDGNIIFKHDMGIDPKDKEILIIEDIVDSGYTLNFIVDYLYKKGAKSVRTCVLLDKKMRRKKDFNPEYVGFDIEDKFVVGYGLDFDEKYRTLPYVGFIE